MSKKTIYEPDMRFNNFTLIKKTEPSIGKNGVKYHKWVCKCDCGVEFITTTKQINKGKKSCGCLSVSNRFKSVTTEQFFKTVKLNHYKNSAKRRNLEFSLDDDYFFNLLISNCKYCGSPPSLENKYKNHTMFLNGVDRVKNELGYVNDNVVTCCNTCNKAKGSLTLTEFKKWINNLIKHNKNNENNFDF